MKIASGGTIVASLLIAAVSACTVGCEAATTQVIDTALGCVETTIATIHAPTGESMAAGGMIAFRNDIAPGHGAKNEPILGVYVPPDSYLAGSAGDPARVCLIAVPKKSEGCNPATDARGRQFLIYDRKVATAMLFSNGEHDCGGA